MTDWGPIIQTLLGAGVALGSTWLLQRHQTREAVRADTRKVYLEMLEGLTSLGEKMDLRQPASKGTAKAALDELGRTILASQLLGSKKVAKELAAISTEIDALEGAKVMSFVKNLPESWRDLLRAHQTNLLNAMRKDLGLKKLDLD